MMTLFWALVVGFSLSIAGQLLWLASGEFSERTPGQVAVSIAANIVLLIWILLVWP